MRSPSLQKPGPLGRRQASGRGAHAALSPGMAPGLGLSPHRQSPEGSPPPPGHTSMGPCGHAGAAAGARTPPAAPSSQDSTEHPLSFPAGPHLQHQQPGPLPPTWAFRTAQLDTDPLRVGRPCLAPHDRGRLRCSGSPHAQCPRPLGPAQPLHLANQEKTAPLPSG